MKKFSILVVLLFLFTEAYPQIIKGKVVDGSTDNPVSRAVVYISGTSAGTYSESDGSFSLNAGRFANFPLVISALGYFSLTLENISEKNFYLVRLEPKIYELSEVVISEQPGISRVRRRLYMEMFRDEFLGETMNANRCEILNEQDIRFTLDSVFLRAAAYKPLQILNHALGYEITYYLDRFECNFNSKEVTFFGNSIFREIRMTSPDSIKVERRRISAYLGSRMQFFRALWMNRLDSAGFAIKTGGNKTIPYGSLVSETFSDSSGVMKYLETEGPLSICYYSKNPATKVKITKEKVYFNKTGYFDPLGLSWSGEMSRQRIGDMLPFEYEQPLNKQD